MISLTEAENFEYPEKDIGKPLKNITLSEADSIESYEFKPFEYERGNVTKFATGVVNTIRDMQDVPKQLRIFGNRLIFGFGGYFGDTPEEIERKRLNLVTAERNLDAAQRERYQFSSRKEQESIAYGVGGGVVSYGSMLVSGGVAGGAAKVLGVGAKVAGALTEAAGIATMGTMELAGAVQDKTRRTEQGEIDIEAMTPEWARNATGGAVAYTALSAITEKYVGFGRQLKMWEKPVQWGNKVTSNVLTAMRSGAKNAISEGATEGLQDLEATGIGLIDGTVKFDELPARIQQAWKSAIIGGIIGDGIGTAVAIKSGRNVRKQLRDMVYPVVGDMNEAQNIAEAMYNAGTDELTQMMSVELELSSELKNKHGKVWNSMLSAIDKAIADSKSPKFANMTEDQRAEYANTAAKHFADQVLAEANKRGATIDSIISDTDITYDNGIKLARHINMFDALKNPEMIPPETKLKRTSLTQFLRSRGGLLDVGGDLKAMDAIKGMPGLISKKGVGLDDAALSAWEHGYFPEFSERPSINDLLEAIDEELRGNKRYNIDEQLTFSDQLAMLEEKLDREGIDWRNMSPAEIEQAVNDIPELQRLEREAAFYEQYEPEIGLSEDEAERLAMETEGKQYPVIEDKGLLEYYQITEENAKLDAENPAYDGETITINGKERTVYNSNGDRIAKSKEALENFYNWFGDSKVVDENGRPLVVYHGGKKGIKAFSNKYALDENMFFFTSHEGLANEYRQYNETDFDKTDIYPVYLNITNPLILRGKDDLETMAKILHPENTELRQEWLEHEIQYTEEYIKRPKDWAWYLGSLALQHRAEIKQYADKNGYDGILDYEPTMQGAFDDDYKGFIVFNPNQIKSVYNRGTFSTKSNNIYYQTAFHGTGVEELEGGKFSVEKMGTGEGHAAHGYGIYATVEYDIADKKYRKMIADAKYGEQSDFFVEDKLLDEYNKQENIASKSKGQKEWDKLSLLENMLTEHDEVSALESGEFSDDVIDWYNNNIREKVINKDRKQGQVFELDVPEDTYLLNEQLKYENQPEDVKKAIDNIFENADESYPQKKKLLDTYKNKDGASLYMLVAEVEYYNKNKTTKGVLSDDSGAYKLASEALNRQGVKGITYDGGEDGRSFVIFNPDDVGVIRSYYQRGKGVKGKTTITPDAYIINLMENADESTLPHEFAHYWLSNMWNYVRSGRASESYMNRWNTIADYLGVKPEQTSLKRGQQEKFASSYEAYLTRGDLPTPAIQSAFDDYDKWLQRVYNDYNKINYQSGMGRRRVRLTDAAIKFFQSMTSGVLEAPALAPVDTGVALEELKAPEVISDNAVVEVPTMVDTTRVVNITEGEKGVSKVFQREGMINADRIVDELGVEYHKINLEDQAIKATEWVRNNLEEARKVVNGAPAPEGIIDTAIFIAYENEMLRIGNNAEYTRALKIHSQVQTQRGQAIAAERIATNNMTTPAYWLEKVINNREQGLADRLFKGDVKKLRNLITDETKKAAKEVLGKSREEQREYLQKLADRLRKENNINTLYQLPDEELDKDNVMNVIHNFLEEAMGVTVTQEESDALINKAEQLKKVWDNTLDKNGNPSVEGWRTLAEMNKTVEAMSPSHIMTVMSSIYGRSAMLASVKSPTLNIMSNLQNFITEGIVRRFTMGKDKSVNKDVIKEYMKYSWETYNASGFIVSGMQDVSEEIVTLGESRPTTQGRGKLRKIAQVSENIVFKYLMGAPDAVTKDLNFVDTADLLATKIAKDEGAKDISDRSTEIFKDAILINPVTEQGKQVRAQAIEQAHIATYTNNSKISDFSLKARQWLNMIGGNKFKLGDVVMPFVKTPANVQMMGLEYGFGSLYTLYKINDIMRNPASEVSQRAIKAAYRNGVGLFLAMMIAAAFDPDDYIPEFDNATTKDRELAKAKNAPFNSIKIGNKWVSLDYFGPLGIPLVAVLNARKGRNLTDQITNFVKAGIGQGMKIPGIKEGLAIWDSLSRTAAYSTTPEKAFDMVSNALLDQIRARTIPAIVNDVAKIMDEYERDTSGSALDKVQASIPLLREQLPQRYTISGKPLKTESAASILFFGGRVKTAEDNRLVKEINKLSKKEEQPSISDVTRYGDLRLLSPEKKIKARRDFYKEYAKESKKLISSSSYKKLDAGDKKKALDKIRRNIVKDLKEKYAKDIKKEKRRR